MRCPYCNQFESKVCDSRTTEDDNSIRRRRECLNCGKRFTTYERVELIPLMVIKKNQVRESFDRQKLLRGLLTACQKRKVSLTSLEALVDEIERDLKNRFEKEVSSQLIGQMVLERLINIDEVAYIRFASVYREFGNINKFWSELDKLSEMKKEMEG